MMIAHNAATHTITTEIDEGLERKIKGLLSEYATNPDEKELLESFDELPKKNGVEAGLSISGSSLLKPIRAVRTCWQLLQCTAAAGVVRAVTATAQ
eukprot:13547-Heterococcus_DN1.PRE.1